MVSGILTAVQGWHRPDLDAASRPVCISISLPETRVARHNRQRRHIQGRERRVGQTGGAALALREPATAAHLPGQDGHPSQELPARTGGISERGRWRLTGEGMLWAVLLALTAWTRFWDLGSRTLHHDESLHVHYSWEFATGAMPYVHDPLMHGPFLFHANALVYLLFGDSNATSRLLPALAGVLIVAAPWLLRDRAFLGRWGALAAGFLLAISPAFLYYTRFIRHDPYTALGSLVLCIAIFRYIERPQRRWMIGAFVCVAFLLANHEIIFAILLVFVAVLWGALLLTRLHPLIPVHVGAAGLLVGILVLRRARAWEPLPAIPWRQATPEQTSLYYEDLIRNPFVLSLLGLAALFVVACVLVMRLSIRRRTDADGDTDSDAVETMFGQSRPHHIAYGTYHALRDGTGLVIGGIVAVTIFLGLFTTLFTNPRGVATATYSPDGTLLYWLGQQEERRGSQPWFYFITEGLQYEWLAMFLGAAGLAATAWQLVRMLTGRPTIRPMLFPLFVASWTLFLFAVLSWAGEKMPWLIMHIVLPASLLGGMLVNDVIEGAHAWRARTRRPLVTPLLAGGLVLLTLASFFLAARLSYGQWTETSTGRWVRRLPASALADWWQLALVPAIALALIGLATLALGPRRAAYGALTAAFIVASLFQVHAGFRLTFLEGDSARHTMIYNTVGSDVGQLSDDLEAMSRLLYGDLSMPLIYDDCSAWPLNWNLRDMPNRRTQSTVTDGEEGLPPVIIGVTRTQEPRCSMPSEIEGYTMQPYTFRWHEQETAVYRNFAIAPELPPGPLSARRDPNAPHDLPAIVRSIWNSMTTLADPEGQQRAFRLLMYREVPEGVIRYQVNVHIRDDVLPFYNEVRYGE
jgi:predicted membrane-bound mannosyltransferase